MILALNYQFSFRLQVFPADTHHSVLDVMELKQDTPVHPEFPAHITKCLLFYSTIFRVFCSAAIVSEIDFDTWKQGTVIEKKKIVALTLGVVG